ncbi:hypothetical protein R8Z50_21455 [Longispora sp. K20-0274]
MTTDDFEQDQPWYPISVLGGPVPAAGGIPESPLAPFAQRRATGADPR